MKKRITSGRFPRIFTIFAKNTAHNERRLRKNAYLCSRGGESVTVIALEAFSFFHTDESRQLI